MLRAQIASRPAPKPVPMAPAAVEADGAVPQASDGPAIRRRSVQKPAVAAGAATELPAADVAAPKRRSTRKTATADVVAEAPAGEAAPKRRATRKVAAKAESAESVEKVEKVAPKRRTTRKTAEPSA